jgi:hypothetical protein
MSEFEELKKREKELVDSILLELRYVLDEQHDFKDVVSFSKHTKLYEIEYFDRKVTVMERKMIDRPGQFHIALERPEEHRLSRKSLMLTVDNLDMNYFQERFLNYEYFLYLRSRLEIIEDEILKCNKRVIRKEKISAIEKNEI